METPSLYQSALRHEPESLDFLALPLLETRADRQRRQAARARLIAFAAGIGCTLAAMLALAWLI